MKKLTNIVIAAGLALFLATPVLAERRDDPKFNGGHKRDYHERRHDYRDERHDRRYDRRYHTRREHHRDHHWDNRRHHRDHRSSRRTFYYHRHYNPRHYNSRHYNHHRHYRSGHDHEYLYWLGGAILLNELLHYHGNRACYDRH